MWMICLLGTSREILADVTIIVLSYVFYHRFILEKLCHYHVYIYIYRGQRTLSYDDG